MAEKVIAIEGGHKLNGTVRISGAKNATVALIPAAVLADGPVDLYGVPEISDVAALAVLLRELNCNVDITGEHVRIDPTYMQDLPLVSEAVNKLRASYYFMGVLLGKYKKVQIRMPGGCYLGPRPIDLHLKGFEKMGAVKIGEEGKEYAELMRKIMQDFGKEKFEEVIKEDFEKTQRYIVFYKLKV